MRVLLIHLVPGVSEGENDAADFVAHEELFSDHGHDGVLPVPVRVVATHAHRPPPPVPVRLLLPQWPDSRFKLHLGFKIHQTSHYLELS